MNSSSEAHQSPIQTLGINTIPNRFINRMVRSEGFAADIMIHHHYYHPPSDRHHYHHLIIIMSGSNRRSIIIISTIFIINTSTSSLSLSSSSESLQNHFHHHHHRRRRRHHRYYNRLEQNHVEKEVEYMPDSVGHHCYFISQSTKAHQLKKGLNFNINNINKITL